MLGFFIVILKVDNGCASVIFFTALGDLCVWVGVWVLGFFIVILRVDNGCASVIFFTALGDP